MTKHFFPPMKVPKNWKIIIQICHVNDMCILIGITMNIHLNLISLAAFFRQKPHIVCNYFLSILGDFYGGTNCFVTYSLHSFYLLSQLVSKSWLLARNKYRIIQPPILFLCPNLWNVFEPLPLQWSDFYVVSLI